MAGNSDRERRTGRRTGADELRETDESKKGRRETRMIKPCPFCGGKAKISYRQGRFFGWNGIGDKKMKYRLQVICNRCHARGRPITTDWMVNPMPITKPEEFAEYIKKAENAWNTRKVE